MGWAVAIAILTSTAAFAQGRGHGNGQGNGHSRGGDHDRDRYEQRGRGHDRDDRHDHDRGRDNHYDRGRGYDRHDHRDYGYDRRGYGHGNRGYAYGRRCGAGYAAAPPRWASNCGYGGYNHVYFPDYYTFYDPYRGGYVYWQDRWCFSRTVPAFMARVDLGRARRQVMEDVALESRPEEYYNSCARSYPARSISVEIPIPIPRIVIR